MSDHSRRNFLRTVGVTAAVGISGCLRLTNRESENRASTDSETPSPTDSGTQTPEDNPNPEDLFETLWQQTNRVYNVSFNNGYLYGTGSGIQKIDASDGSIQWSSNPEGRREDNSVEDIVATDNHLFVLSNPDPRQEPPKPMRLFNIDPDSGEQRWYFEGEFVEWPKSGVFTASDNYVAYFELSTQREHKLYSFSSESSDPLWTKQYNGRDRQINQIEIQDGRLFSVGDQTRVFDLETGELLQTASQTGIKCTVTNTAVYVGAGQIRKLSRPGLTSEWTFEPLTSVSASPVPIPRVDSTGKNLIVPTDSTIHCLNSDTGESKWNVRTTDRVLDIRGGVAYINGLVWIWDNAGILYIIDSESGQLYYRQREKEDGSDTSHFITDGETLYSLLYTDKSNTLLPYGTSALEVTNAFT